MAQTSHSKLLLIFAGVLLMPAAPVTPAQSLGEVARQYRNEQEARKKKGEVPAKVFTNDDISRMPPIAILKSSLQTPASPDSKSAAPSQPSGPASAGTAAGAPEASSTRGESREQSKGYWQAKFKAARAVLAHAKEEQTLVEDELRLLQIQQARELNPDRSRKLNSQIDTSTVELESKRAATERAQRAMEQLEKEFKESGAPQDWIQEGAKPE